MSGNKIDTAMILAAGLGTRLRPVTETIPKALVMVNGKPLLESVIEKLIESGIEYIVINAHHFAEQVSDFIKSREFNADINVLIEERILGTGGGIKNAKPYLEIRDNFIVYNVDVSSDIDLHKMFQAHLQNECIATLATNKRKTSRPLLFDSRNILMGRKVNLENFTFATYEGKVTEKAFCGIHILSSRIFATFPEESYFDIIDHYMELVKSGSKIRSFDIGSVYWKDLGKLSDLLS